MGTIQRIAPIFAVHDLDVAMRHYQRLGFTVRAMQEAATATPPATALRSTSESYPATTAAPSSAYLFVDNADDLAAAWRSAGAEVHSPHDTEWGQHEGAVVGPHGNVIRFGSPIGKAAEG
jgi:hypothetical protein